MINSDSVLQHLSRQDRVVLFILSWETLPPPESKWICIDRGKTRVNTAHSALLQILWLIKTL